jgi:putative peptide zinc metalloprotease protein
LGLENPEDPFLPQTNHGFFALYTIAAVIYRWFVFFSIMFFLNQVFEPYGLKIIGQMIASMGIFGLVVVPFWKMGKFFAVPGRTQQVKLPRLFSTIGVAVVILALIAFLPLPHNVRCSLQLRPQDTAVVYVEVPGRLQEVLVKAGDSVEAGQPLARLKNLELEIQIAELEGQLQDYRLRLNSISDQALRAGDPSALSQKNALQAGLESVTKSLADKRQELRSLTLASPRAGIVIPPPSRNGGQGADDRLPGWSDTPLEEKNQGIHLMPSDPFCQVADPKELEAILAIDQSDVDLVRLDQTVKIKLEGLPGEVFEGTLKDLAPAEMKIAPKSLSQQMGGDMATRTDASGVSRPLNATYQARVTLEDSNGLMRLGMRGRAKIKTPWRSLGSRAMRYLARTFHFYI